MSADFGAAADRLKTDTMELCDKSVSVAFDNADLKNVVECAISEIFAASGQTRTVDF